MVGLVFTILAINPGSTSTKIAVYLDEQCQFSEVLRHSPEDLKSFAAITDQYEFRLKHILAALERHNLALNQISAVVGRGGSLRPIPGGTYLVNDIMRKELAVSPRVEHASNLGAQLAHGIAGQAGTRAYIVDPVCVDEMQPIARITGLPEIERESLFHALNMKAVARRVSKDKRRDLSKLALVMAHLGGGISFAVQHDGKMIDVLTSNDEGPFTPERAGGLPMRALVKVCCSGNLTYEAIMKKWAGEGGFAAHLGITDAREIEKRIASGDNHAALIFEALAYQVAKCLGGMATVLSGKIDFIVLTGGLAYSERLTKLIADRVAFIAPLLIYPGEDELQALAEGCLRVLRGEETAREYSSPKTPHKSAP
jgi:butyrate kinase